MMEMIKKGVDANEAVAKCTGNYGRFDEAAKYIDPCLLYTSRCV